MAHDPVSNAATITKESSTETPSTDRDARINHASPAGHDPDAVKREDITSSGQPLGVAETDRTLSDGLSRVSATARSAQVVQENGLSPDQPHVVTETGGISPDDSSPTSSIPAREDNQKDETLSDRSLVVTETDDLSCVYSTTGSEHDEETREDGILPDQLRGVTETDGLSRVSSTARNAQVVQENGLSPEQPHVVAETGGIFPDDISYISSTTESDHGTVVQENETTVVQGDGTLLDRSLVVDELNKTFPNNTSDASFTLKIDDDAVEHNGAISSNQPFFITEIEEDEGNRENHPDSAQNCSMDTWTLPLYTLYNLPTNDKPDSDQNLSTQTWPPLLRNKTPDNTPRRLLPTSPLVLYRTPSSISQINTSHLFGQILNTSREDDRQLD
jgi:hypothetical protein